MVWGTDLGTPHQRKSGRLLAKRDPNMNEDKIKPNYWSVTPATVRYDKRLPGNVKQLYGEISALTNKDGYCWATNKYFAELYEVHKNTISEWVSTLVKYGYVEVEIVDLCYRKIYIKEIPQITQGYSKKPKGGTVKSRRGDKEKAVHNNKVNNKDNINNIVAGKASHAEPPKAKKEPQKIAWPDYLKNMKENPNETIQVIALYFEEKKLKYETDTQAQAAIKRNLKASKRLIEAGWTPKQVFGAFNKAKAEFKALWTLETIEKILLDHQS